MDERRVNDVIDSQINRAVSWAILGTYLIIMSPLLLLTANEGWGRDGILRELVVYGSLGMLAILFWWEMTTEKYSAMWRKKFTRAKCEEFGHKYIDGVTAPNGHRRCMRCMEIEQ